MQDCSFNQGKSILIMESCSSSGVIGGEFSGGICGEGCSGEILITDSSSSGDVVGNFSGGIAGSHIGTDTNSSVHVSLRHSTGDIAGRGAGGICGVAAAFDGGYVSITYSYSSGNIDGRYSGGMCGDGAALVNGFLTITQSFSLGEISGPHSGGIIGRYSSDVHITDSFSRGAISGPGCAGGVCGSWTGGNDGTVIIRNVYASGRVQDPRAGGIIGRVKMSAKQINVTIVGANDAGDRVLHLENNSGHLGNIIGRVFCYQNDISKCWDSDHVWRSVNEELPILRGISPPWPSPIPKATQSPSPSPIPSHNTPVVDPTKVNFEYARDVFNSEILERKISISVGTGQRWQWRQDVADFVIVPPDGEATSDSLSVNQSLQLDTKGAPTGLSVHEVNLDILRLST